MREIQASIHRDLTSTLVTTYRFSNLVSCDLTAKDWMSMYIFLLIICRRKARIFFLSSNNIEL